MRCLTLTLLGGFEARLASGQVLTLPSKKTRAMLAYLALRPGRGDTRDRLATLFWGDTAEAQARKSLRQAIAVLRKTLSATHPPSLVIDGETIALNLAAVIVDVVVFERLLARGTPKALERAAALYRGDLLDGFSLSAESFEEWLMPERERMRELALEVFAKLLAHQWKTGETERAIHTAVRLLAYDPTQEAVHRVLMRCYARQGRRGRAVRQYQACVAALRAELGAEPDEETKKLRQDIIRQLDKRTFEPPQADAQHRSKPQRAPFDDLRHAPFTLEAPLIGREPELARLRGALDRASGGHGHVVAIVGEAGIGKSSILMAFAAEAQARGVRILLGCSHCTEQVLALSPWGNALRTGDVVADVAILDGVTPRDRAELVCLLPELDAATGEGHSRPDRRRLFDAVTRLVCRLAAKAPVLIMLEDVHWADEMTLRLVAYLARRISTSRVLAVVTMRTEELASAPVLRNVIEELSLEPHFIQLALPPLTRTETTALAQSLTSAAVWAGVAGQLDEQIWRASEGNPLMVVETLRAIHESAASRIPGALPLPERVRRLIAERMERLSDRARHLLSVAAVIGREFEFALLRRAAGVDEREVAEGVEELVRRRLLQGLGERLDFTHDRIREVAYGQLLQPHRELLHVQVAKALEKIYAGDLRSQYARLAGHYHAGKVWEKALIYFRQAGAQAMRLSAYREAVVCFEQALQALPHLANTRETLEAAIDVRFDLQNCLRPLAEFDKIRRCLEDAEGPAKTLADQRRLGQLSVYMSDSLRTAGRFRDAIGLASTARDLGEALGDSSLRLGAELILGAARFSLSDYRRATEALRRSVRSLDDDLSRQFLGHHGFPAVLARAYLAQSLAELGEFDEGLVFGEEGIRIAEALDHPLSLAYASLRAGDLHALKGELDRAALLLERACGLTRDRRITFPAALATGDLGHVYVLCGRLAEGLSLLREAMGAYESMNVDVVKTRLLVHFGDACLLGERIDDAYTYAEQALAHARARGERGYEGYALHLLGEIAAHREPPDIEAAEAHYRESMTLAAELGMRPLLAHCHRGLGTLYGLAGKTHAALEHLTTAAMMFRQMNMGSWLEQVDVELAALS